MVLPGPLRIIHARAPLRINDIGGWTDTWFAGEGKVLNLAVSPAVEVQVRAFRNARRVQKRVRVYAENYGLEFEFDPDNPSREPHPLLQFTLAALPIPAGLRLEVRLFSPVPAGISTGTSASVCVALLGALNLLLRGRRTPLELAGLAHVVETEKLQQQSGIQDQICAARGGISFIHMRRYPRSRVQAVKVSRETWTELDRRLMLIYLGKPHLSSALHEEVIALLKKGGPQMRHLGRLRVLADKACAFLTQGDLDAYGATMVQNNECQRALYGKLISPEADAVIGLAKKRKASGWKVNGAGGRGGSLTILAHADDGLRRALLADILELGRGLRPLPVSLSAAGLQAWQVQ